MSARPQRPCAVRGADRNGFSSDLFACEFSRRVAKIEINSASKVRANSQAIALACKQHVWIFFRARRGLRSFCEGNDSQRSIGKCGDHRARRAKNVEPRAVRSTEIAFPGER